MNARAETVAHSPDLTGVIRDLVALTKPRVTALVAVTFAAGVAVAPGAVTLAVVLWSVTGTLLVVGSANALNMVLERDVDGLMARTRSRPLPTGRLSTKVAAWFGFALGVGGLALLWSFVNPTTTLLAAGSLASYVLAYTPLKRSTPLALYVGAVPGAAPPLLGWTTVTGAVDAQGAALFAILFAWQIPHFCAIAISRADEYRRAGLAVLPVVRGERVTRIVIVASAVVTLAVTLVPAFVGLAGVGYVAAAVSAGAAFVALALRGLGSSGGRPWARSVFFASMPYLVVVYGALVIAAA